MQIKTFSGSRGNIDDKVNHWLSQNPAVEIKKLSQSSATLGDGGVTVVVTILFDENLLATGESSSSSQPIGEDPELADH